MLKTKSGYFFLSFALLIVAVITPVVLVTSLNDLSVKTSINLYKNRVDSFNIGENLVDSKFSGFLSQNPGSDLYGISELLSRGEFDGEEPSLEYKIFSQSSLTPTTLDIGGVIVANNDLFDSMGFKDRFKVYRTDGELSRLVDIDNFLEAESFGGEVNGELAGFVDRERGRQDQLPNPNGLQDEGLEDAKFVYTLPALGTGNATDLECVPFDLNSNILGSQHGFVDPLDHPCNYNKLVFGDMIVIPLFYIDDSGQVANYEFDSSMQISFRAPCNELQEYCNANNRIEFPEDESLRMAILGSQGEVFQGKSMLNLQAETTLGLNLSRFSELGLVVNGDRLIEEIIRDGEVKPMLILQSENNNLDVPYLEYQVRSAAPFADDKVTMTANIINSGRTYKMESRQFRPEINVDLGVVFGN